MARLLFGQDRRSLGSRLEHRLAVLPHAEAADRIAVEVERGELLRRAAPELAVEAALRDREAQLPGRARQAALALRPQRRPAHRLLELGADSDPARDAELAQRIHAWFPGTR